MSVDELSEQGVETQTIDKDLSCSRCGYNLKGLDRSGNCPECGQPIEETLTFGLHSADPEWLRYQSITMLLLGALAVAAPSYGRLLDWYSYALRAVGAVLGFYAIWRLTRPDPHNLTDRDGAVRRGLLVVGIGCFVLSLYKPAGEEYMYDLMPSAVMLLRLGGAVVQWWLVLLLVSRFAARTQNRFLQKHARVCLWAFPISQVAPWLAWLILQRVETVAAYVSSTVGWLGSFILLATLMLLGRMHEVLRSATAIPCPAPSITKASSLPPISQ